MDIEGLERDVVKSKHDEEDPVLLNRRERYKRQVRGDHLRHHDHKWHDHDEFSDMSEMYDPAEYADHFRDHYKDAFRYHPDEQSFDGDAELSLVRTNLHKTYAESGIDINQIRVKHGHGVQKSYAQLYSEELEDHQEHAAAPANAWEVGVVKRSTHRMSMGSIKPMAAQAHERSSKKQ